MTSLRQWAANRRNSQQSTGPRTEEGKRRSRGNALRHGLTAETVVEDLEDTDDYRAFEATIIADYDAHNAVERELVLRLASLLWRIRRATGIETDLFRIQADIIRERAVTSSHVPAKFRNPPHSSIGDVARLGYPVLRSTPHGISQADDLNPDGSRPEHESDDESDDSKAAASDPFRQLTYCFLRLANLDNTAFDRLSRYEARLWRQVVQTIFALEPLRRRRYRFE